MSIIHLFSAGYFGLLTQQFQDIFFGEEGLRTQFFLEMFFKDFLNHINLLLLPDSACQKHITLKNKNEIPSRDVENINSY